MPLPDDYLARLAATVHAHVGLFVLDCIASGALCVDMQYVGVDVLIAAPQKTWSATLSAAMVMLLWPVANRDVGAISGREHASVRRVVSITRPCGRHP